MVCAWLVSQLKPGPWFPCHQAGHHHHQVLFGHWLIPILSDASIVQEYLTGTVVVENKYELKHEGVLVSAEGSVDINFNLRSINFMDTFHGSNKSIMLIDYSCELLKAGRLAPGRIELP